MAAPEYQQRVIDEHEALKVKLLALHTYVNTDQFHQLDLTNQLLLRQQLSVMDQYCNILDVRISLFV